MTTYTIELQYPTMEMDYVDGQYGYINRDGASAVGKSW